MIHMDVQYHLEKMTIIREYLRKLRAQTTTVGILTIPQKFHLEKRLKVRNTLHLSVLTPMLFLRRTA